MVPLLLLLLLLLLLVVVVVRKGPLLSPCKTTRAINLLQAAP